MIENHIVLPYADDDAREEPYDSGYNEIEACDLEMQAEVDRLLALNDVLEDIAYTNGSLKRLFDRESKNGTESNSGADIHSARRDGDDK